MIKWNANFQIPDATIQLADAYIRVVDFKNVGGKCYVKFSIEDDTGEAVVKQYDRVFDTPMTEAEIYETEVQEYSPAEIV